MEKLFTEKFKFTESKKEVYKEFKACYNVSMNKGEDIQKFILENISSHPGDIGALLLEKFDFSRQAAHKHLAEEVKKGTIIRTGNTRWTRYFLTEGNIIYFTEKIKPGLAEDIMWSQYIKPMTLRFPENIRKILSHGFTEIFNNAIDHSGGTTIFSKLEIDDTCLTVTIMDNGVGIFKKIQQALNLDSMNESILHLSKGKFTTDPTKHSGEGIFFTTRMFDQFSILSSNTFYSFENEDWFLSSEKTEDFGQGTMITMKLRLDSTKTPKEIFDQYADQEIGFHKTIVAVALSSDPSDPHVSRSQAKRLLMGLEKFKTIVLNFKGVESVGQAFVDEIFRVFQNEHPNIKIHYVNASEDVEYMIKRGITTIV